VGHRSILDDFEKSLDPADIRTPNHPARGLVIVLTAPLLSYCVILQSLISFYYDLLTAIVLSLGGSSPYPSTDKTNKNKYT